MEKEEREKLKSLCEDHYFDYVENKFVHLYFFYVFQGNCEQYTKTTVELKRGILTRETMTDEIVRHRNQGGRRYHVTGIYRFCFDEPDLMKFVETPVSYLHTHKQVEVAPFPKSPELFQHHNSMFILLGCDQTRKSKRTEMPTKRLTLKNKQ
jgi:hypothetical protein